MNPKDLSTKAMQSRPQITPDLLRSSQTISCECGGLIFSEKLLFKKISSIISPSGRDEIAPMPIIVCDKCGRVPSSFDTSDVLPKEVRAVAPVISAE
jgi:hypothetical protein